MYDGPSRPKMGECNLLSQRGARVAGFTIIELMVVVALVAVLASLAAPALQTFIATQQLKTASFDLYASLAYARGEAVKYSAGVIRVAPINSNWNEGWTVSRVPTSGSATVVRRREGSPRVTITDPDSNDYFEFRRNGRPTTAVSLTLTVTDHSEIQGRCVYADPSGNPFTKLRPTSGC